MDQEREPYPHSCPVCRTAMVGVKDDPDDNETAFDRHMCLSCGTVINTTSQRATEKPSE